MAFTTILASQTDADSPIDTTLMDLIRTNLDDLDAARVTNGDSHDHAGGDGAPILLGGIGTSAIKGVSIYKTPVSSGNVTVASLATYTPAAGVYMVTQTSGSNGLVLDLFVSAAWRRGINRITSINYFDGTYMRIYNGNASASETFFWQSF